MQTNEDEKNHDLELYHKNPNWDLKERIYQYCLFYRGGVTFAELRDNGQFEKYFNGDLALTPAGYPNIIVWIGLGREIFDAIQELLKEEKLFLYPTPVLTYIIDGGVLNLPIAKRLYNYKTPRWIPMVLNIDKH